MSQKKVLIIDNNLEEIKALSQIVKERNCEVFIANSIVEAIKILDKNKRFWGFARNKINAILLNLDLPENDSLMFLEILRKEERRKTFINFIPVIVYSDFWDIEKLRIATHPCYGMAAFFFRKPYNVKQFSDVLDKIFYNSDLEVLIELTRDLINS